MLCLKKPTLVLQLSPTNEAPFQVLEPVKGDNYYEFRLLREGVCQAVYRYTPAEGDSFTIKQLARAGAKLARPQKMMFTLVEYRDSIPVFSAIYGNGSCMWSTDSIRTGS